MSVRPVRSRPSKKPGEKPRALVSSVVVEEWRTMPEDGYRLRWRESRLGDGRLALEATLWQGAFNVGSLYAEEARRHRCHGLLRELDGVAIGVRGLVAVLNTGIDPDQRGRGRGRWMYDALVTGAARHGFAVAPHVCLPEGTTSTSARRAWAAMSMDRAVVHGAQGRRAVWGGARRPSLAALLQKLGDRA